MDYEKKYNEALERARNWCEELPMNNGMLKDIFPELRESEDERIRKAIVHLLEVASEAYLVEATGFKKEQFLSYLEKQKEQKPAKWEDWKDKTHIPYCSSEPEWSEEDEHWLKLCIGELQSFWKFKEDKLFCKKKEKEDWRDGLVSWLKSLHPQSKQRWSEEDEKMLANLRSTLSNLSVRGLIKKVTEQKYSAWLKSLRPQKKEDLPKWLVDEDYDEKIDGKDFSLHPVGLAYRGFYIPYSDLLKLPREDEK